MAKSSRAAMEEDGKRRKLEFNENLVVLLFDTDLLD
jgi:hypothetical protein